MPQAAESAAHEVLTKESLATLEFELRWQSPLAAHTERFLARRVNIWRDILPQGLEAELLGKGVGETGRFAFRPGTELPPKRTNLIQTYPKRKFMQRKVAGRLITPMPGRFYPRSMIHNLPGHFPQDQRPLRLLKWNEDAFTVDLNHPLAAYPVEGGATIAAIARKPSDVGGQCHHWMETVCNFGPGMQARYDNRPTVFHGPAPLPRAEDTDDARFYTTPRLINHVDAQASSFIRQNCAPLLQPGGPVLDLMSSMQSHLPENHNLLVTGLGMNMQELEANPDLSHRVVHDLNADPTLPFEAAAFGTVLCHLSVEYLTDPQAVFNQVRRVLAPGGHFIVSFTDRWFPNKVVTHWPDLHPFERLGLVLEYFDATGGFTDLHTLSIRNWWRPEDDPHYHETPGSDPVFMVRGRAG
jgi:SAM-dependent methyltransferase/FKBP-type peptidyl-prolyl cis-trans isomerase 2